MYQQTGIRKQGFTIVELLITIVVIAILAAMTLVAYNNVTTSARNAKVKSSVGSLQKKIVAFSVLNDRYPNTLLEANDGQSSGLTAAMRYSVDNTSNPKQFCVSDRDGGSMFKVDQTSVMVSGECASSVGLVTRNGYVNTTPPSSPAPSSQILDPGVSIPNGSWMIAVFSYTSSASQTMPAGWVNIVPEFLAGTLRGSVYAKIKTASDTFPLTVPFSVGANTSTGGLMWGSGSAPVASWIVGARANRDGTPSMQSVTQAPAVTTSAANTLVLSFSFERTIAAEADIASIVGATKWFYIPQPNIDQLQTITVGYQTLSTPAASSGVTVNYPNPQTTNGAALQIAIPPAP